MTEHRDQAGDSSADTADKPVAENGKKHGIGAQDKIDGINMGKFSKSPEINEKICQSFDHLRCRVRELGLLSADNTFFVRKFAEAVALIAFAVFLQSRTYFFASALTMGLAFQQLGWMIHEYGHQQHFGSRWWNDACGYVCGNLMQGFSLGGWKEQHNVHHAAPNVDGRDGDLDLLPLWATVGTQLKRVDGTSPLAQLLPFQHLYWTFMLPMLRISWLLQSIQFAVQTRHSFYDIHRERALVEQLTLALHWTLVLIQYYYLPDNLTRLQYFLVSNLFAGFLIAHVVTYNHYSADKFAYDDPILENYACLQLYTTRNMRPGLVIDWLWGGLNYQIEHHLFPTMPRHNLKKVMPLVKQFCAENDVPYMVDDYFTGFRLVIEHLRRVAEAATDTLCSSQNHCGKGA
uniref:FA_desaturase domain-containing protein n=1 Tax=Globodera pallida TaxID=36090 RepID=A0A183CKL9_GLOPA